MTDPNITPDDVNAARVAIRSQSSPAVERMLRLERLASRVASALDGFASVREREDLRDLTGLLAELRHFTQFAEADLKITGTRAHYNPDGAKQDEVTQRLVDALLRPRR